MEKRTQRERTQREGTPQDTEKPQAQQSPSPDCKPSQDGPREIPRKSSSNQPAFLGKSIVK